jgi:ketosteroid isomerase-like protein
MTREEDEARQATSEFYQALDDLLLGKGLERMQQIWQHADFVTTVHPFGHWARGWTEVWTTWQEIAAVFSYYKGHRTRSDGIGNIHDLKLTILGDSAYAIGVYKSCLYLPEGDTRMSVNCTNILRRQNGVWKIVHHHPDQAPPEVQRAIAGMVEAAQNS